jgi:trk system potassium uptake protein TrkH
LENNRLAGGGGALERAAVASKSVKKRPAAGVKPKAAKRYTPPQEPTLAGWLFPGYLAIVFLGYVLMRTPGATVAGQELSTIRAIFWSVNAATLTGFPQGTSVDLFPTFGQSIIFGILVSGTLCSLIIGGTAVSRILRLGYSDGKIVLAAFTAEIGAIVLGGVALIFLQDLNCFQAIFQAASAVGNCGMILGTPPDSVSAATHLVLLPLMTLGGFGICVLLELYDLLRGQRKHLSRHTRVVLGCAAWMYVLGTLVLFLFGLWQSHDQPICQLAAQSAAAAVASRTGGMCLVSPANLGRPVICVLMLLMSIGAASGGTAGGIKMNSFVELFKGIRKPAGRPFRIAMWWIGTYAVLVFLAALGLHHQLNGTPVYQIVFNTISAASNVGLTFEHLDPEPASALILSSVMLIGRFAPLMFLWWMADTTTDAELAVG